MFEKVMRNLEDLVRQHKMEKWGYIHFYPASIKEIQELAENSPTLSEEQKAAIAAILTCLQEHKHPEARRTGIGGEAHMADLFRYCYKVIDDAFNLSVFADLHRHDVANYGRLSPWCVEADLLLATGRLSRRSQSNCKPAIMARTIR